MGIYKKLSLFEDNVLSTNCPKCNKSRSGIGRKYCSCVDSNSSYTPGRIYTSTSTSTAKDFGYNTDSDLFGQRFSIFTGETTGSRQAEDLPGYVENNPLNRRSGFLNYSRRKFFELREDMKDFLLPLSDEDINYKFTIDYDDSNKGNEIFDIIISITKESINWRKIREDILQVLSFLESEAFDFLSAGFHPIQMNLSNKPIVNILSIKDLETLDDITFNKLDVRVRAN